MRKDAEYTICKRAASIRVHTCQVLQDGGQVDRGAGANTAGILALLQVPEVNAQDRTSARIDEELL